MHTHVDQPELERMAARHQGAPGSAEVYRHVDDCEVCLRLLIEAELRLAAIESDWQVHARTADRSASAKK
jgi:hypothetical protein